jgi:ubiquinone/menaquinone biosynthesis C-methylase UbiE
VSPGMRYEGKTPWSRLAYRLMVLEYAVQDFLVRGHERALDGFGIAPGFTVVEYGCGPGRYLAKASRLAAPSGKVYAADISETALEYASARVARLGLANVTVLPILRGRCAIPDASADLVYALDMFHAVRDPRGFLAEIRRFTRPGSTLILEDGHQPRKAARRKVLDAGGWRIEAETRWHLRCVRC